MKKVFSLFAMVVALGLSTVTLSAEAAKRMGSGKSVGTQRQAMVDKSPAAAPPTAPAAATGAAAASPSRSWMGPVAGLAAGLGLAALASHLGFGDELASMVMMGLLAAAVMMVIGFFLRKRMSAQQSGSARPAGLQYAHAQTGGPNGSPRSEPQAPAYRVSMPASGPRALSHGSGSMIGSGIGAGAATARPIPADFDTAAFERHAKLNFIRLQAAHDAGNLSDIREFTSPEMFAELKLELAERGNAIQRTEVVRVDAQVLEVDEDADRYLVSVRFTGLIRDTENEQDESFDELWHLTKSRGATGGWVLGGIQQVS